MSAGVLSMDELAVAVVLSWPFSSSFSPFFFCTVRQTLVYIRGCCLMSISLLLLLFKFSLQMLTIKICL